MAGCGRIPHGPASQLTEHVQAMCDSSDGIFGHRSRDRVGERLGGEADTRVQAHCDPSDPDKVIEDLIWRAFTSAALGNRLAGDTNYLRTDEVWQYLATVIDLWHPAWSSAGRWPITCEPPRPPEC